MKVICRNYRKSGSPDSWLVRDQNQEPQKAKMFSAVLAAGNVSFSEPSWQEAEKGVRICISAHTASGIAQMPHIPEFVRLYSGDGIHFKTSSGLAVNRCTLLYLGQEGWLAVLPDGQPEAQKMLLGEARLLPPRHYSLTQRDDVHLGNVSCIIMQLAALRLRIAHEMGVAQLSLVTDADSSVPRTESFRRHARLEHKLRLVDAMYQFYLRSELEYWEGANVTLRRGGEAVVTAADAAEDRVRRAKMHEELNKLTEKLAGGQPVEDDLPPGLAAMFRDMKLPPAAQAMVKDFLGVGHD